MRFGSESLLSMRRRHVRCMIERSIDLWRRAPDQALALANLHVGVGRRIVYSIDGAAGPAHFDEVNPRSRSDSKYLPRIVRREVASASGLEPRSLDAAREPGDRRAHRRGVAL